MIRTLKSTATIITKAQALVMTICILTSLAIPFQSIAQKRKENKTDSLKERRSMDARMQFFNGIKEKNAAQYDLAIMAFKKSAELDPQNDAAYYEMARINIQNGDLVNALANAKQALAINGSNVYYKALNADISLQLGQNKEALKLYQSIIDQDPENVDAYLSIAAIYEGQKNYPEANKYYSLVEAKTGVVYEILQQKINNYITAGDFDKAIDEVKILIKNYPDEIQFQEILADLYGYNKQGELAKQTLLGIVKNDPTAAGANLKLAKLGILEKDIPMSVAYARVAFQVKEHPIDAKMELMFIYFEYSNTHPEILPKLEDLASVLTMVHSEDAKSFSVYGDVLNTENKFAEAREQYRKAVTITPAKHLIWQEILRIDTRLSDFDGLIADSEKCLALFPTIPTFYYFNGVGNYQKKKYTQSIESLEAGVALVIDDKQASGQFYAALGDSYNGIGNKKRSDDNYEQALKINPDDSYVLNNYSYFLSLRGEKLDRAKEMAERVNKLNPNTPSYQDTYAWILFKLQDYQQAKTWLDKALAGGGDSGEIFEHYGDVLYKLGNESDAIKYWQKAKAAGDASPAIDRKISEKKLIE